MINLKPKMFDEASKSHASPNLAVQLISFVVLFLVIYLAESIVPAILSYQPLMDILTEQGKLDAGQKLSISEAIEYSTKLTGTKRFFNDGKPFFPICINGCRMESHQRITIGMFIA